MAADTTDEFNGTDLFHRGSAQFSDFDLFREALSGWDTEPIQITTGALKVDYDFLNFADLHLARMRINRRLVDPCAQETGWYNFVICLNRFVFCGTEISPGWMMVFGPGREYRNIVPEGWWSIEIGVSETLLHQRSIQLPGYVGLAPENSIIHLDKPTLVEFWKLEQEAFRPSLTLDPPGEVSDFVLAVREHALQVLETTLAKARWASTDTMEIKKIARYDLTNAALKLIGESELDDLNVAGLSDKLGVSSRALQYSFDNAGLGGPARYLMAVKLNRARRDLVRAQDSFSTVTHAAMDHGFTHLGRFSEQYRRLFGELPSETLHRAQQLQA